MTFPSNDGKIPRYVLLVYGKDGQQGIYPIHEVDHLVVHIANETERGRGFVFYEQKAAIPPRQ